MIKVSGIGSIRFQAFNAVRSREIALERSVATVDDTEADNGAARSDVVRFAAKEQSSERYEVPLSVYLQRAAKYQSQVKKTEATEKKKPKCPIEQARADSTTGENAPLNWLVADHFGGQADVESTKQDLMKSSELMTNSHESIEFTVQPKAVSQPQSLFADEWLLSPCA